MINFAKTLFLLSIFASSSFAAAGCPAYIGNKTTKQMISGKGLTCSGAKIKGFKLGDVIASGIVKPVDEFMLDGSADLIGPVFQVGKKGGSIEYSFDDESGKGGFKLDLYEATTDKKITTIISARGPVDITASSLNKPGVYYVRVTVKQPGQVCESDGGERFCEIATVSFSISYTGGSGGGGDDFGFDF